MLLIIVTVLLPEVQSIPPPTRDFNRLWENARPRRSCRHLRSFEAFLPDAGFAAAMKATYDPYDRVVVHEKHAVRETVDGRAPEFPINPRKMLGVSGDPLQGTIEGRHKHRAETDPLRLIPRSGVPDVIRRCQANDKLSVQWSLLSSSALSSGQDTSSSGFVCKSSRRRSSSRRCASLNAQESCSQLAQSWSMRSAFCSGVRRAKSSADNCCTGCSPDGYRTLSISR
jgi:hypothetical protein